MARLVVLDRDGVINRESDDYICTPAEWEPLPGSLEAIARLCDAGYRVVVATNQSGVARGLFSIATLEAIHRKMSAAARAAGGKIDGIFYCPHGPDDGCDCRKPLPGLLRRIEQHYNTSLAGRPVIGDALRDLEAAIRVGARPVLVRTGKGEETAAALPADISPEIFADLGEAAERLIGESD